MKNLFKQFSLLVVLLALSFSAQAGINIEHWTTANGARVYFVASPALPILDVRVDFSAGSAFNPAGKSGLAGLTSSLLTTGATLDGQAYDEEQIAEKLADLAASLDNQVDADRAGLSLRTLSSPAERNAALQLMRAALTAPTFPTAALTREKSRTVAAIQEAETRPSSMAARRFQQAMYPGHPYGAIATVDSVTSLTREDVINFWRTHYTAPRAVISIIGAVDRNAAENIAALLSEQLPAATTVSELPAVSLPEASTTTVPHPAMQSHIQIGMPALKRGDDDFFALQVGNYILGGGGFVSRLMQEVREKRGYAYSVYSYFDPRKFEGPFEIGLQTKREQAGAAIKLVNATLDDFLKTGPTAKELQAAKQNLIDGLALKLDSNAKILGTLAMIGFYDLPLDYLDTYPDKIAAVTAAQVRAAFVRHVQPAHLVTVVVAAD
jgi:zinc protease